MVIEMGISNFRTIDGCCDSEKAKPRSFDAGLGKKSRWGFLIILVFHEHDITEVIAIAPAGSGSLTNGSVDTSADRCHQASINDLRSKAIHSVHIVSVSSVHRDYVLSVGTDHKRSGKSHLLPSGSRFT